MKTKDAKEKKFRELSDEELKNVNGGREINIPSLTIIGSKKTCFVQSCPPGYKLDRSLDPCQCVEEPNTFPIVTIK